MGKEITSLEQIITESVVVGLGTTILLSIPCSIFSQMEYTEQLMQLTSPLFFLSSAWIYSLFRTYGLVETLADEEDKDPIDIAIENLRDSRKLRTSVNYYLSIGDHHQVKNIMDHVIEDCPERKVK